MRPVIEQIDNFDALSGKSVIFYYGGNQSHGSTLTVYNVNDFTTPVYVNTTINMQYSNAIDSGVLQNGTQYAAEITSVDINGNWSEVSNKVYFWCLATPIFRFTNVSDGEIFNNQSITAQLLYEQADGIDIAQFKYELYDSQMSLIEESEYYSNYSSYKTYAYNGLENNAIYYIRSRGSTTRSQPLDTGYISIFIQFEAPSSYSILYANADNGNGVIEYNTNIRLIEPNRDNETYEYDAGLINLENDIVTYDTNFVLDGDFVMAVRHKETVGAILTCSNPNHGFKLWIVDCSDGTYRYKLEVPNELCNYILYSQPFEMNFDKIMTCWIKRVNNLYEIYNFVERDTSDEYNLFLGQVRPMSDLARYDVWIDLDKDPTIRIEKDDVVVWITENEPTEDLNDNDIWIDD